MLARPEDLRECAYCHREGPWLKANGWGTLKPIPREKRRGVWLQSPDDTWAAPKGLHCEMCIELWRDALVENLES